MLPLAQDIQWWISAIELPVISSLFWLFWRERRDTEQNFRNIHHLLEDRSATLRENLSAFKLEVAHVYAQSSDLRELEARLTAHLLRIEAKLDTTALKTEALNASKERK